MPTLQQQIAEKFLAKLAESKDMDAGRLEQLRILLSNSKELKADDLVKVFSQPAGGDVKVDQQWNWRQNRALDRRLHNAKLRGLACAEDLDWRTPRGLDRTLLRSLLADSEWVRRRQNLFLLGPTGIGKSFLAVALAHKACRDGFTALYTRAPQLFRDLALARADGSLRGLLARLARVDVLVVDDWAMAPLAESERRDFLEICEDRYQLRSTILTSQLPVAQWHTQIGDPTVADSILDRLVHNAHRIEMQGESMRKRKNGKDSGPTS